jgi:hypothetical protein
MISDRSGRPSAIRTTAALNENNFIIFFTGEITGHDVNLVKARVREKFRLDDARLETLFSGEKVILKRNLDKVSVWQYIGELEKLGMVCQFEDADADVHAAADRRRQQMEAESFRKYRAVLWVSIAVFVALFFIIKNISVLMVANLLIALVICHILHREKYEYPSLFPDRFWSINRKAGVCIILLYVFAAFNINTMFPKLKTAFAVSAGSVDALNPVMSPFAGFVYIIILPILGVSTILYYDVVYKPHSENERGGADVISIILGCGFIGLSCLLLASM